MSLRLQLFCQAFLDYHLDQVQAYFELIEVIFN